MLTPKSGAPVQRTLVKTQYNLIKLTLMITTDEAFLINILVMNYYFILIMNIIKYENKKIVS